jgi:type VI secretion system protein ImpF
MSKAPKTARFVPPIMQAFRASFEARDSSKQIEERNESGETIVAGRRTTPRNAVSASALQSELAADLQSLLNTVNMEASEDLEGLPEVKKSILNFGVDDMTSITADTEEAASLDKRLREILLTYEPRLIRNTVAVIRKAMQDDSDSRLAFHITSEMHATPHDIAVEFVADVETYSGQTSVKET